LNNATKKPETVSRLTRGYLICLAATVFWSTTAIFIRYLTVNYHLPPLVLAFWRDLSLAIALGLVFTLFNPPLLHLEKRHWRFMLLYGVVLAFFNSLWTISVALNGAAVSTVLAYSSAAFTAVLGWWFLHETLDPMKIVAVTLSLLGCVFVSGAYDPAAWSVNPLGIITGLASGILFAVYNLMGKKSSQRKINPWTVLVYAFGVAALLLFCFTRLSNWLPEGVGSTNLFWLGGAWLGWLILITLAVGPTVGGFGLYTVSLGYLPASVANVIATLEPVMTAILAFMLLGEYFTPPQWAGSLLIIAGVIVLRVSEGRARVLEPA
jgi:drug/metabolite transporter (DMT)-like permease